MNNYITQMKVDTKIYTILQKLFSLPPHKNLFTIVVFIIVLKDVTTHLYFISVTCPSDFIPGHQGLMPALLSAYRNELPLAVFTSYVALMGMFPCFVQSPF